MTTTHVLLVTGGVISARNLVTMAKCAAAQHNTDHNLHIQNSPPDRTAHKSSKSDPKSKCISSVKTPIQWINSVVFDSINKNTPHPEAYAVINIESYVRRTTNLCAKEDSGAQGNILPLRTYKKIFPNSLIPDGHSTQSQPS